MCLIACIEIAIASHTTEAEKILVFQIGTVAPTEHLESNQVLLTSFQIRSQVKLCLQFTIFTIAHEATIYPQIHIAGHRTKVSNNLFAIPRRRDSNLTTVRTHVIILHRYLWRITLKLIHPSIANVYIQRITKAIEFPHTRHRHLTPSTVVITNLIEVGWPLVSVIYPMELPCAIQCHEVGTCFHISTVSTRLVFISKEVCMHRQAVHRIDLRILPFILLSVECQA